MLLAVSFTPGYLSMPAREGILVLGLPLAMDLLFLGTSPTLTFNNYFSLGNVPELPPGFDAVNLYLQGIEISAEGTATLSEPEHLTLLDSLL